MENYTTILKLVPICDCGYIFRGGVIISEDVCGADGFKHKTYSFAPPMCPNCKKKIEGIECIK